MYRRNDPRFRRTLNEISQTIESANETAQARVYVFGQSYINPCLSGISSCFEPCLEHCFPGHQRGRKTRGRGRAELSFDFYDDWEEDEADGLLGWDDEEYDGFLSGPASYGAAQQQPARQRAMSYGTRRDAKGRRKSDAGVEEGSSYFGFINKLTGKLGKGQALRYKPSAAGLQEHPGTSKTLGDTESEPLMTDESDGDAAGRRKRHGRNRSGTTGSEQTTSSFSSRGDLFPSEDEDDAVMLDDEFAMVLERRNTGTGSSGPDDSSSVVVPTSQRPRLGSRKSTRTRSSRSTPRSKRSSRAAGNGSPIRSEDLEPTTIIIPTLNELKQEEEQTRAEEEVALERRRSAAQKLAEERGLTSASSPILVRTPAEPRPTPERQQSQDTIDTLRRNETEKPVSSIATLNPPVTPSRSGGSEGAQQSRPSYDDFGDFEDPPSAPLVAGDDPKSSSFEAARLPRFS